MTILSLVGEMKEKRKKKEMLNNLRPVIIEIMNVGKLHQNTWKMSVTSKYLYYVEGENSFINK